MQQADSAIRSKSVKSSTATSGMWTFWTFFGRSGCRVSKPAEQAENGRFFVGWRRSLRFSRLLVHRNGRSGAADVTPKNPEIHIDSRRISHRKNNRQRLFSAGITVFRWETRTNEIPPAVSYRAIRLAEKMMNDLNDLVDSETVIGYLPRVKEFQHGDNGGSRFAKVQVPTKLPGHVWSSGEDEKAQV